MPHPTSSSIAVEVELVQDAEAAEHSGFCNIGRLAEVRFQRGGLGLVDRMYKALTALTDGGGRRTGPVTTAGASQ